MFSVIQVQNLRNITAVPFFLLWTNLSILSMVFLSYLSTGLFYYKVNIVIPIKLISLTPFYKYKFGGYNFFAPSVTNLVSDRKTALKFRSSTWAFPSHQTASMKIDNIVTQNKNNIKYMQLEVRFSFL